MNEIIRFCLAWGIVIGLIYIGYNYIYPVDEIDKSNIQGKNEFSAYLKKSNEKINTSELNESKFILTHKNNSKMRGRK